MQTLGQMIAQLGISFQGNQLNTCKLNIYHFHHRKIQHNFLARKIESITDNWLALEDEDDDSDEEEEKSATLTNLFEEYDDDDNTDVDSGEELDHIFDFFQSAAVFLIVFDIVFVFVFEIVFDIVCVFDIVFIIVLTMLRQFSKLSHCSKDA